MQCCSGIVPLAWHAIKVVLHCRATDVYFMTACLPVYLLHVLSHQLRVFSRVPVVVGTIINHVTCHPTDLAAKLWLDCGAASSVQQTAAAAAAEGEEAEVVPSAMAYEILLED
jgi:hypothetical protein